MTQEKSSSKMTKIRHKIRIILEWPETKLWSTGRYASKSELTRQKPKEKISTKN